MIRTKPPKNKSLVRAYLEQSPKGTLLAWWNDPRSPCPSLKYPISDVIFGALVEQFRREGMSVTVDLFGKEVLLSPHGDMIKQ
jgi:hypothetical protein